MYLWDYLKTVNKPIVMYGMGNGGDKIFERCDRAGIPISGVFSSDDHQSGAVFHGHSVGTLSDILSVYPDPVILLAFGTERPELLRHIKSLSEKFEILAPDVPLFGGPDFTPSYCQNIKETLLQAKTLFEDDLSQRVFEGILKFKETGNIHELTAVESDPLEKRRLIKLEDKESFLDLGAYNGDTIDEFIDWTGGKYGFIHAFEPDAHNFKKLQEHTASYPNLNLYPYASWMEDTVLTFTGKGGRNCGLITELPGRKPHIHNVAAKAVDSFHLEISHAKLDVEGAEAETLSGMKETLNRCHPSMQVSVYHKTDDFINLPLLIHQLCPGYRMYLRHHPALPAWELQLYCIYDG